MAKFYPQEIAKKTPDSEITLRNALSGIPGLIVFHSLAWQGIRNGRQGDGEADFLILDPKRGLLLVEVKGGIIDIQNGVWHTTNRRGRRSTIKNPFEQATASKHALIKYLEGNSKALHKIPINHAVCFPDISIARSIGTYGPRPLVIDADDLTDLPNVLGKIFTYWRMARQMASTEIDDLVGLLAPTTKIYRRLHRDLDSIDEELIELTHNQIQILHGLRLVKRVAVVGGAGTGKTVLAVEKARQLASADKKTLLLCYNELLRAHLIRQLSGSRVDVHTFHSFAGTILRMAGQSGGPQADNEWFESRAADDLAEALKNGGPKYDAVILDEAQDFSREWISSLLNLLVDDTSTFYMFLDSHQDLFGRSWTIPEGFITYFLSSNCRNTLPIAKKVASVFDEEVDSLGVEGREPTFIAIERDSELTSEVTFLVDQLISDEKIPPQRIVVLSNDAKIVRILREMSVAEAVFTTLDGRGVAVETISRFKGLEREVVVLALSSNTTENSHVGHLAYVGMSRARGALYVIGTPEIKHLIRWPIQA